MKQTIATDFEFHNTANSNIDDSQKALVLFLEFLLVKYLYSKYALLRGFPTKTVSDLSMQKPSGFPYMSKLSFQYGFSVFLITLVVFVCSPPIVATANGSGKPAKSSVTYQEP